MLKQNCEESLPLTRLFRSPSAKVLDFLFLNRDFDYSESDISQLSGVPSRTLQRVLPILKEEKLIKKTRTSSRSAMYTANLDSGVGESLFKYVKLSIEANLDTIEESAINSERIEDTADQLKSTIHF
jgi:predicted transcriptional regulator